MVTAKRLEVRQLRNLTAQASSRMFSRERTHRLAKLILEQGADSTVVKVAIQHLVSLGSSGNKHAVRVLLNAAKYSYHNPNLNEIRFGLRDLAQNGVKEVIPELTSILCNHGVGNRIVAVAGLASLAQKGHFQAFKGLKDCVISDPVILNRHSAIVGIKALAKKGIKEAVPVLIYSATKDKSTENRESAIIGLVHLAAMGKKSALPGLEVAAVKDENAENRHVALTGLEKFVEKKVKETIPSLAEASLKDSNLTNRYQAQIALCKFAKQRETSIIPTLIKIITTKAYPFTNIHALDALKLFARKGNKEAQAFLKRRKISWQKVDE